MDRVSELERRGGEVAEEEDDQGRGRTSRAIEDVDTIGGHVLKVDMLNSRGAFWYAPIY